MKTKHPPGPPILRSSPHFRRSRTRVGCVGTDPTSRRSVAGALLLSIRL